MRSSANSLAAALASAALACATGFPAQRGEDLEARVKAVEERSSWKQLQDERAAGAARDQRIEARLAELQKKVEALAAAPRSGAGADAVAALERELRGQRALLEAQGRRLDALEGTLAEVKADRSRLAARAPPSSPPRPTSRAPPLAPSREQAGPAPGPGPEAPPGEKGEFLALARAREASGDRAVARELYEQYVASFPDDPSAAEAYYRLGELAFAERRFGDAIGSYGKVAQRFPKSRLAPDALLRTAESMIASDLRDDAVLLLTEIPKRYPGTSAAARAQRRLDELKGGSGDGRR